MSPIFSLVVACLVSQSPPPPQSIVAVPVLETLGFQPEELVRLMDRSMRENGDNYAHFFMTLQDATDEYLTGTKVRFVWRGGAQVVPVPQSGLIHFDIDRDKLDGLWVEVPADFSRLRQRSVPDGVAYDGEGDQLVPPARALQRRGDVLEDPDIMSELRARLTHLSRSGNAVPAATFAEQLRRTQTPLNLPPEPAGTLTPAEIYRRRRDAVVVFGSMTNPGQMMMASGVILTPDGVIATNYHVFEKVRTGPAVFGVLTREGMFLPIVEVLAASRAADLALVRVEARELPFAPLAEDAEPGEPITVISHPSDRFYSLTQGFISRFFRIVNHGKATVRMAITADFAVGSSGAPVFNQHGAVCGIVATTNTVRDQMVFKDCPPVHELRALIEPSGGAGTSH